LREGVFIYHAVNLHGASLLACLVAPSDMAVMLDVKDAGDGFPSTPHAFLPFNPS
jgi:hypothetical protein